MRYQTLSACFLLACFSCSKPAGGLSAEGKEELSKVIKAFDDLPTDLRAQMAAEAVVEIEIDRLPLPLLGAFDAISNADAESKAMLVFQRLSESMLPVNTMCKGRGTQVLNALEKLPPQQRLDMIRKRCETDRFDLVPVPTANTNPTLFFLAHVALSELQSKGGASSDEKSLLRYLALAELPAIPPPPAPAPKEPVADTEKKVPLKGIVKLGKVETIGAMDKKIVHSYVHRKASRLLYCYEKSLVKSPGLIGTVNASFSISPSGSVLGHLVSGIDNVEVESCMASTLKTIKFPKPRGGGMVEVKLSFELSSE